MSSLGYTLSKWFLHWTRKGKCGETRTLSGASKLTDEKIQWKTYQVTGKWAAKPESQGCWWIKRSTHNKFYYKIYFRHAVVRATKKKKTRRKKQRKMCQNANAVGKCTPSSKHLAFIPLSKSQTKLSSRNVFRFFSQFSPQFHLRYPDAANSDHKSW